MSKLRMTVYSDYICPWCYVGAVRFQRVQEEFKGQLEVTWKSYLLFPRETPRHPITAHSVQGRQRANLEEPAAVFKPWKESEPYPNWSMPSQLASRAALLQGEEAFQKYHLAIFKAFFTDGKDISSRSVLLDIAGETELDTHGLSRDMESQELRDHILAEHQECWDRYGNMAMGIPLVTFNDGYPLVGAAPTEFYRRAIQRLLDRAT